MALVPLSLSMKGLCYYYYLTIPLSIFWAERSAAQVGAAGTQLVLNRFFERWRRRVPCPPYARSRSRSSEVV